MPKTEREELADMIKCASEVFKEFGFKPNTNTSVFNFSYDNPKKGKTYSVFCSTDYKNSRPLIKRLLKFSEFESSRLVIVCPEINEMDAMLADDEYCLVEISELEKSGIEMIEAKRKREIELQKESLEQLKKKNQGVTALAD